jgi:hypothetical protein
VIRELFGFFILGVAMMTTLFTVGIGAFISLCLLLWAHHLLKPL